MKVSFRDIVNKLDEIERNNQRRQKEMVQKLNEIQKTLNNNEQFCAETETLQDFDDHNHSESSL